MIERLLVGLGGTIYTPVAIERAGTLAKTQGAEVTGVTVLDPRRLPSAAQAVPLRWGLAPGHPVRPIPCSANRIEESIQRLEQSCQEAGVRCRVLRESGDTFTKLMDVARYHDLMVFGLRSAFSHDFLAGDPESLLIRLVGAGVHPMISEAEESRGMSRVLMTYSGSLESAKAMKRFVQMRLCPAAELKIMTFHPSEDTALQRKIDRATPAWRPWAMFRTAFGVGCDRPANGRGGAVGGSGACLRRARVTAH